MTLSTTTLKAECCSAKCRYVECRFAKCRGAGYGSAFRVEHLKGLVGKRSGANVTKLFTSVIY
jgi:hypothetical protein